MYALIKPVLFSMQPEKAHYFAMNNWQLLNQFTWQRKLMESLFAGNQFNQPVEVAGLTFPNQVGLAAGFDKDARWVDALASLGFGHVEIGTLTPRPQPGNEKPRLFRLVEDEALINRMGFNNEGVEAAVQRLAAVQSNVIIGGNIGKNKVTPNEKAWEDYRFCFRQLFPHVHYFTVNVSSPNTPGLRELQEKKPLEQLLNGLVEMRNELNPASAKPIFLKIAPDLGPEQLSDIIDLVFSTGIDGLVATNTTISREGLKTSAASLEKIGAGGLSGKPVREASTAVLDFLVKESGGKFPIIGVGGIMTPDDAKAKLDAGASLVQLYTGFIYGGLGIVKSVKKHLAGH
ncbi:MAG: quinone-dependent dihydroorotate dehydrogenase [Bacteroidota bacterium]|nr:quinone-dependent dihydroorotate dehydrogenase [Bacteroidota bacterium]MDX5430320.1 quinone-dependent dihydroorotate dehydrogenase [Bacteroidota bacterium]MDX5469081.1 quinone-dependent dihydroorotate dehydrogenase [Bacteroidota bacterium]